MKPMLLSLLCLFGAFPLCACSSNVAKESTLHVPKIRNLSDDFLMGADVSSLLSLENSGTVFHGFDGQPQDAIKTLGEAGVNCIRLRIWNDPYDANGNGYGGGNCDLHTALTLGLRAKEYGMRVMIDFHYSDFWADPGKQFVPKAWKGFSLAEKEQAIYDYTAESLKTLLDAGVPVSIVQIGNEINNGICGETIVSHVCRLLASASRAVRDTDRSILVAVHYTNPENNRHGQFAENLHREHVDYDVFASSYYPFWHGTLENLTAQLRDIAVTYGKKVMIAETAWTYTENDTDGHDNILSTLPVKERSYPQTIQGQARQLSDVIAAMASIGDAAIGIFYWEPAWITVPAATQAEREQKWETFGSGWASSFAGEYDPEDAGKYYGGSSCDNQALFDANGDPLESMKTFSYVHTGTRVARSIDSIDPVVITVTQNGTITLPKTVPAIYNTGEIGQVSVVWSENRDLTSISRQIGIHRIRGMAEGRNVACYIQVEEENFLKNPSFEDSDLSMWNIRERGALGQTDHRSNASDAHDGKMSLHFWHDTTIDFTLEQTVDGLDAGNYRCTVSAQGGDIGEHAEFLLYAIADGVRYEQVFTLDGWLHWQSPTIEQIPCNNGSITVGISVKAASNAWGTIDDFRLHLLH